MKKAFDSVPLQMLKLAIERIKIPSTSINFIINLFKERKTRVLTAVGPTDNIIAADGIEQDKVLSSLVWRIFYDSLISRVQSNKSLGYTVLLKEPLNLRNNLYKETKYRQAAIAYADDTTWIANSKTQLESILKIAEEFYAIKDIRVNPQKSKLIVINSTESTDNKNILLTNELVEAEKSKSLTRFLGV